MLYCAAGQDNQRLCDGASMPSTDDLHAATENPVALRRLIEAGADIEQRDDLDCTPLFYAVLQGNLESLEVLIQAGANVNAVAGEPGCDILASPPLNLALQCRNL